MALKLFMRRQKSSETETRKLASENEVSETLTATTEQGAHIAPEVPSVPEPEPKPEEKPAKKKKVNPHPYRWMIKLGKLMVKIAILTILFSSVWIWVGSVAVLHDNNMYPSIKDGDLVVACKLMDYLPEDIVLYESARGQRMGRIVARGGDIVNLTSDGLYTINGNTPYEMVFYNTYPNEDSDIVFPYEVPENCIFVMNDMREMMTDSRTYGAVSMDDVEGKVVMMMRHRGM